MACDIERLTQTGETEASLLSPEEVAARNSGYNADLYGNLPDGINEPTGDVETPGDQDESRQFFGEATAIAAENNKTLDADKEHPNGFKTIEFPPMPIDYLGVTGTHHVKLIESAPDTWECVIENDITSGNEQDLPPEYRNMQRPLSLHETQIKHSILSHPELIDPEDQKNLRRVADPYAELTSPEEAA